MLCAISGEAPQAPVVSKKSGNVFEKRLIEAYISEHGTDPITNEELTTDDLLDVKSARVARPRPPTLTSIPSLLTVFQNEWDALALETYTLRQQLAQTRQELSTALYQNDAAVRVVAKLTKERDEARDALSKISVNGSSAGHGQAMEVDSQGLSEALVKQIKATQERLSKTRRKRPIPENWATADSIAACKPHKLTSAVLAGSKAMAVDASGDLVLASSGDKEEVATIFSISEDKFTQKIESSGGAVTAVAWDGARAILATSKGTVEIFEGLERFASFTAHAGEVTSICLHPSQAMLASAGIDKSFIFYDLTSKSVALQIFTDSALSTAAFHPDGHLFAAGGTDGKIKLFDVASGSSAAEFVSPGPLQCIAFSENGTWLASVSRGQTSIQIWDLRKAPAAQIASLEIGSPASYVQFDYTGQFLLAAGPSGLSVQHFSKSTKEWSEPLRSGVAATAAGWGQEARSIIALTTHGEIAQLQQV